MRTHQTSKAEPKQKRASADKKRKREAEPEAEPEAEAAKEPEAEAAKGAEPEATKEPEAGAVTVRRKRRARSGRAALREMRKQQKVAHQKMAIRRAPFARLVKEVISGARTGSDDLRVTRSALNILQEVAEMHLINVLSVGQAATIELSKGTTLTARAVRIADTILTKPHMLSNSVRGTDLCGVWSPAEPAVPRAGAGVIRPKKADKSKKHKADKAGEEAPAAAVAAAAADSGDAAAKPDVAAKKFTFASLMGK
jgi:histone H3/H4